MRAGVEQPFEIAQDAALVATERNHALAAALLGVLRIVVRQPVEQAGLQLFKRRDVGHSVGSRTISAVRSPFKPETGTQRRLPSGQLGADQTSSLMPPSPGPCRLKKVLPPLCRLEMIRANGYWPPTLSPCHFSHGVTFSPVRAP